MALRVLLADESPTIKKVFQLALQDFAVDVKSVNVGLDVVQVAKDFQPDIVFADVLLQKHSGYDVCSDIRMDSALQNTPVVLMWSGFMDLDEQRFASCKANGRIEKPFDVNTLRTLIQTHVPKTQKQTLSKYLSFPKLPEFSEAEQLKGQTPPPSASHSPVHKTSHSDEPSKTSAFETCDYEEEAFTEKPLYQSKQQAAEPTHREEFQIEDRLGPIQQPTHQNQTHGFPQIPSAPIPSAPAKPSPLSGQWNMDSFDPIPTDTMLDSADLEAENAHILETPDAFEPTAIGKSPLVTNTADDEEESTWVAESINRFQIDDPLEDEEFPQVSYNVSPRHDTHSMPATDGPYNDVELEFEPNSALTHSITKEVAAAVSHEIQVEDLSEDFSPIENRSTSVGANYERRAAGPMTRTEIENYIQEVCERTIRQSLADIIPKVAEKVIQAEIDRILKNTL